MTYKFIKDHAPFKKGAKITNEAYLRLLPFERDSLEEVKASSEKEEKEQTVKKKVTKK